MQDSLVDSPSAERGNRSTFLTYEPYYGLKEKAFSLSADPRFLYKSRTHAVMFEELRAGIRRREGIIVLTGEPGTGKTTLCRGVLAALDRKTFCAFVPDPFMSREDLLKMLLIEFGVMSVDDMKSGRLQTATRPELSYPLYEFLRSLVPLQAYAVLILDEAQNLSSKLLEEIRVLSDLEGPEKLLQLVLVGQPELRDKLKDPAMRQVDQRISVRCSLEPLGRDVLPAYIAHRLSVAGGGADRVEFTSQALDLVYGASNGNPRVLNLIADKSLHRGHLDRSWTITPEIVIAALGDLGYPTPALPSSPELPADFFLEEDSLPEDLLPEPSVRKAADDGPHFLLEEAPGRDLSDGPFERVRRHLRRTGLFVAAVIALGAIALILNAAGLVRQSQPLPSVAAPPAPSLGAGAAPVIPPPEFFASVKP